LAWGLCQKCQLGVFEFEMLWNTIFKIDFKYVCVFSRNECTGDKLQQTTMGAQWFKQLDARMDDLRIHVSAGTNAKTAKKRVLGGTRTRDLEVRSLTHYPTVLQGPKRSKYKKRDHVKEYWEWIRQSQTSEGELM
jgi:hypothetical protein